MANRQANRQANSHANAVYLSAQNLSTDGSFGRLMPFDGTASELTKPAILHEVLRLHEVEFQPHIAVEGPAVFTPEDVEVHLGCVYSQFSAGADCPVGYDALHLVFWEIMSLF